MFTRCLVAFLHFNFPPASVFLGDSGSMLVGLVIGFLTLRIGAAHGHPFPLGLALSIMALPFMDTAAAILRRTLTGRSMATADRSHLHHCLTRKGYGPRRLVLMAWLLCCIPWLGVWAAHRSGNLGYLWLGIITLAAVLIGSRSFGFNELKLILNRLVAALQPFMAKSDQRVMQTRARQIRLGLKDSEECNELWNALTAFADQHDLSRVRLHLSGSWMEDGYDVLWEHIVPSKSAENWNAGLPVYSGDKLFGKVEISGTVIGTAGQHILAPLGDLLQMLTPCIHRLFKGVARRTLDLQTGQANRILFINRSYWPDCDATGQLLTELCEDLAHDFDVSVLVGQPNQMTHSQAFRASGVQVRNDVEIYRIGHSTFQKRTMLGKAFNLISFTLSAAWQAFWIPKHQVVVVETDPFLLALVGGVIKKLRGSKLIIYMQDVYPDVATSIGKVRHGWATKLIQYWLVRAYRYSDQVIVLGEDMKRRLVRSGVDAAKIQCIPNWVDAEKIYPIKQDNEFRKKHGLEDKFVVMHSGNLGLTQQLDDVLEAAARLRDRDDIRFVFIGDGASRQRLEQSVDEQQLSNVIFLPYQPRERLAISLSAADLHVVSMHPQIAGCLVPSKFYGIMATGTPVLAIVPEQTDIGENVQNYRTGLVVNPGDVPAIEIAVRSCADGEVDLATMSQNARTLAVEKYDRRHSVDRFVAMLDDYMPRAVRDEDATSIRHSDTSHRMPTPHAPLPFPISTTNPALHPHFSTRRPDPAIALGAETSVVLHGSNKATECS